jgi:bifunctional UDP-N-acetylglucosamine pyrophosphorylase/glucosamine-1-phosphate N-acetyltransferase
MAIRQFHQFQNSAATLLTATVRDPFGYGRILRDRAGDIERIVEEQDASDEQRKVREVNGGVYLFKAPGLGKALQKLRAKNPKGEQFLTDTIQELLAKKEKVQSLVVPDASEVLGVNDQKQLTQAHRILNLRRVGEHQRNGVTFLNPKTVEMGPRVEIGQDSVIEGQVQLRGETVVGENCRIESGSWISDTRLEKGVVVRSSRIWDSQIGEGSDVGPFAHIRGGCRIEASVHIGTNAELKNAKVGRGSMIGHFSYVGDAQLGKDVNVGAGCVFANYDGKKKHECHVGDKVFLGSNSTLVAPVKIGNKAVVGAGSVVTRDVPAGMTVVGVPAKPIKKRN